MSRRLLTSADDYDAGIDTGRMQNAGLKRSELGQHILTAGGTFVSVRPFAKSLGFMALALTLFYSFLNREWDQFLNNLPFIAMVWITVVAIMTLLVSFFRVRVFVLGIEGRSFMGFRRRFLWKNLARVRTDNSNGIPFSILLEKDTGREMWILREITERNSFLLATMPYIDWKKLEPAD